MVQMTTLPNEVLLLIIENVESYEIESLALCNKQLYALSEKAIELHQEYWRKYRFVRCSNNEMLYIWRQAHIFHPVQLLEAIFNDERKASYPLTVQLSMCNHQYSGSVLNTSKKENIEKFLHDYGDRIKQRLVAGKNTGSLDGLFLDMHEDTTEGFLTGILASIVLLLPNLQAINFECACFNQHCRTMIKKISSARSMGAISHDPLAKVGRLPDRTFDINQYQSCKVFAELPSIRQLSGAILSVKFDSAYGASCVVSNSDMSDLDFRNSYICHGATNKGALESALNDLYQLRVFQYMYYDSCVDRPTPRVGATYFAPRRIKEALLRSSKESLRTLDITGRIGLNYLDGYAENFIGSLQDFTALKTIRIDEDMLAMATPVNRTDNVPRCDKNIQSLVEMLPSSVETLTFATPYVKTRSRKLFTGFTRLRATKLPQLLTIHFEKGNPVDESLVTLCKDVGVVLTVDQGSG